MFGLLRLGDGPSMKHPRWDRSWATPTEHTIDDLAEMGHLRIQSTSRGMRTFVFSMRGRETAEALVEQVSMARTAGGRAPPAPEVLEWLRTVEADAPEAFDLPSRLIDRAVSDRVIDSSGREALAGRILRLIDERYVFGKVPETAVATDEQLLANTTDLELTMRAHEASLASARGAAAPAGSERVDDAPPSTEFRDVFISHASEDKAAIARPLAEALRERGCSVWFDEYELDVGWRVSGSIDEGLRTSRYGVIILSPAFMQKRWPQRELAGLLARETGEGKELILPVWHEVTEEDVRAFSAPLVDLYAVDSREGVEQVAKAIVRSIDRRRRQETSAGHAIAAAELRAEPTEPAPAAAPAPRSTPDDAEKKPLSAILQRQLDRAMRLRAAIPMTAGASLNLMQDDTTEADVETWTHRTRKILEREAPELLPEFDSRPAREAFNAILGPRTLAPRYKQPLDRRIANLRGIIGDLRDEGL
jgi:hypothetical protein